MDDVFQPPPPRRWPWIIAILFSLVWAAGIVAGWAVFTGQFVLVPGAEPLIITALALIAPLAVVWLAMAQLRDAGTISAARAEMAETRTRLAAEQLERGTQALAALEAQLEAATARLAALDQPVTAYAAQIDNAASNLDGANRVLAKTISTAIIAAREVAGAVPVATVQTEGLVDLLDRTNNLLRGQLAETETLLAALYTRASEAEAQARTAAAANRTEIAALAAASQSGLDAMAEAADRTRTAVATPIADLETALAAAFERTTSAMDTTRDAVHAQTNAMLASVEQAGTTLAHIGDDSARAVDDRLATLATLANRIAAEIATAGANTTALVTDLGGRVEALEERLASAIAANETALLRLDGRMADATAKAEALAAPLSGADAALAMVEARLTALGDEAARTLDLLDARLPANQPLIATLADRLDALKSAAEALAEPIISGANAVDATTNRLAMARETLAASNSELSEAITRAQEQLHDMEASTGRLGLSASGELIESFGRVRDVAQAAAGAMRTALAGVVAEAEEALGKAAVDKSETAFAAPIRSRIEELVSAQSRAGDAAQAAAERIAQRLLALTRTISEVEAHVDAVETRAEVRSRNSLGRRANSLIDSLQSSAVDLAELLDFDIDDRTWSDFAAGDRSAIARRLTRGLDHGAGRQFARHFSHDDKFRTEASRYLGEFEALVAETVPERGGEALGAILLSSTLGKLYLAIGQAAGRFN